MKNIISFFKEIISNITGNYYKLSYILLNMLIIFFIEKYICNNEIPYFSSEITKYTSSILPFLKFLVLTFFIYGTIEFIVLVFYMLLILFKILVSYINYIKTNKKHRLYKKYTCNCDYESIYIDGLAEKILLSYSYMWIIIGYIFLFNKNEIISEIQNKNIITVLHNELFYVFFGFTIISLLIFIFIYIPLFIKFLMLPIHYEEFARRYREFYERKHS